MDLDPAFKTMNAELHQFEQVVLMEAAEFLPVNVVAGVIPEPCG